MLLSFISYPRICALSHVCTVNECKYCARCCWIWWSTVLLVWSQHPSVEFVCACCHQYSNRSSQRTYFVLYFSLLLPLPLLPRVTYGHLQIYTFLARSSVLFFFFRSFVAYSHTLLYFSPLFSRRLVTGICERAFFRMCERFCVRVFFCVASTFQCICVARC